MPYGRLTCTTLHQHPCQVSMTSHQQSLGNEPQQKTLTFVRICLAFATFRRLFTICQVQKCIKLRSISLVQSSVLTWFQLHFQALNVICSLSALKHLLDFDLPSVLILSALMKHKLSKWPFAEIKLTSISVLLLFYKMVCVLLSIPSVCDFDPLCLDHRGLQLQCPITPAIFGKKIIFPFHCFFSHFRRKLTNRKKK